MGVTVRPNLAAAGALGNGNHRRQSGGFCSPLASEGFAKSAMHALAPAPVILGNDRHGSRKRMPAELACSAFHQDARRLDGQGRQWIRFRSRGVERTGAGQAGDAKFPFRFRVVRLQIVVSDRPILEIGTGNRAFSRSLDKIEFVESPVVGSEMNAAPANNAAIPDSRLDFRGFVFRFPKRRWLESGIV